MNRITGTIRTKEDIEKLIDNKRNIVMLVTEGCAIIEVNFTRHAVRKGYSIFLFSDGFIKIIDTSAAFSAHYASFNFFLVEDLFYRIKSPYFWRCLYATPSYPLTTSLLQALQRWFDQLEWSLTNIAPDRLDLILKQQLYLLFVTIEDQLLQQGKYDTSQPFSNSWAYMIRFLDLVDKFCHKYREVQFYADKLCISTTYLNKTVNRLWHVSPKELIDHKTLLAIKSYLTDTDLPIKQIAVEMNFDDASYFCRYFRRMTGVALSTYRQQKQMNGGLKCTE